MFLFVYITYVGFVKIMLILLKYVENYVIPANGLNITGSPL